MPRTGYQEVLQHVIPVDRDQRLGADPAMQHLVGHARFGLDPNDLVTRLTARAGKISMMILGHYCALFPRPLIPPYSSEPMAGLSMSSSAARHSRARCTRLRI